MLILYNCHRSGAGHVFIHPRLLIARFLNHQQAKVHTVVMSWLESFPLQTEKSQCFFPRLQQVRQLQSVTLQAPVAQIGSDHSIQERLLTHLSRGWFGGVKQQNIGWWFQPIWKIFVKLGIFPSPLWGGARLGSCCRRLWSNGGGRHRHESDVSCG